MTRINRINLVHFDDSTASVLNYNTFFTNPVEPEATKSNHCYFPSHDNVTDLESSSGSLSMIKLTLAQASLSLTKSAVGAGALFMPAIFLRLGWLAASMALGGLMLLTGASLLLLLLACRRTRSDDYMMLAGQLGGTRLQLTTAFCVTLVMMAPIIVFMRLTTAYIINIVMLLLCGGADQQETTLEWGTGKAIEIMMALFVFWPISLIKDPSSLARFSLFGMLGMMYVALLCLLDCLFSPSTDPIVAAAVRAVNWDCTIHMLFGSLATILFSFSSHFTLPSVLNGLERPTPNRINSVIMSSCFSTALIYAVIGLSGSINFGSEVQEDILMTRPNHPAYVLAQAVIAAVNILSFPLLLLPVRGMLTWLKSRFQRDHFKFPSNPPPTMEQHPSTSTTTSDALESLGVIALALLISSAFKSTAKVFDMIGALCGAPVILILPALFYSRCDPSHSVWGAKFAINTLVIVGSSFVIGGLITIHH